MSYLRPGPASGPYLPAANEVTPVAMLRRTSQKARRLPDTDVNTHPRITGGVFISDNNRERFLAFLHLISAYPLTSKLYTHGEALRAAQSLIT